MYFITLAILISVATVVSMRCTVYNKPHPPTHYTGSKYAVWSVLQSLGYYGNTQGESKQGTNVSGLQV